LLDEAAKEFAAHGYDDASINRILLASGLSKGSFYYYFDDKPDLAAAVIEREASRYVTMFNDIKVPSTPEEFWGELGRMMEASTRRFRELPHTTADAFMRIAITASRRPELMERMATSSATAMTMSGRIAESWKRGQEIGAVRDDLPVGALIALIQEVKLGLVRILFPPDRPPTEEEFVGFMRTYLDLIRRVTERRDQPLPVAKPKPAPRVPPAKGSRPRAKSNRR
jgi:AcrR family transcriptional regulator